MSTTKFVAIYTDKEAVGKSTLTLLLAANLRHKFKRNICIIDLDNSSTSLYAKRNYEYEKFKNLDAFKSLDVLDIYPINSIEQWEDWRIKEKDNYDIVFVDFANTVSEDKIEYLLNLDVLIILSDTFISEGVEQELNVSLYKLFRNIRLSDIPLKEVYMMFNQAQGELAFPQDEINALLPEIGYQSSYKNPSTFIQQVRGNIASLSDNLYKILQEEEQIEVNQDI